MSRLLELQLSGEKPLVTGSLFFRDASGGPEMPPGMKLMMVCGVIAVPENFPIEGERMARLKGFANPDSAEFHIEPVGKELEKRYSAYSIDQILTSPIWKL